MKKLILLVIASSFIFAENFLNLKITNETLMTEAQYQVVDAEPVYVRGGYLMNKDKDNFFYVGLKTEGQIIGSDNPVSFSLFVDGVHTKDNSALPIGIAASGYFQQFALPVFARAEFAYAPEILSFDDAKKFSEFKIESGVRFIVNGEVFVGYRHISFDKNYDSHVYGGIGFVF